MKLSCCSEAVQSPDTVGKLLLSRVVMLTNFEGLFVNDDIIKIAEKRFGKKWLYFDCRVNSIIFSHLLPSFPLLRRPCRKSRSDLPTNASSSSSRGTCLREGRLTSIEVVVDLLTLPCLLMITKAKRKAAKATMKLQTMHKMMRLFCEICLSLG